MVRSSRRALRTVEAAAAAVAAAIVLSASSCRCGERAEPRPRPARPVDGGADGGPPSLLRFAAGSLREVGPFEVGWSPETGKGPVAQRLDDGSRIEVCFNCGFEGYTGGLSVGGYGTPGFLWVPPEPVRGFEFLNLWCAFDETLLDRESGRRYGFGWSQNFGERHKGARLRYVGGQILRQAAELLVLESRNEGGCYRLTRRTKWVRGDRYLVQTTSLRNTCDRAVTLDYWVGEDPWIGTYKSSEGDVGWVAEAREGREQSRVIRTEEAADPGALACVGQYDLGNVAAGDVEGAFSGVANFLRLSPGSPRPSAVYFANRFAHDPSEIHPGEPLDNQTLTAFNLGWEEVTLEPDERLVIGWALGIAETPSVGAPPRCPAVPAGRWAAGSTSALAFVRERVEVEVSRARDGLVGRVSGRYWFRSTVGGPARDSITFPLFAAEGIEEPHELEVTGAGDLRRRADAISFSVEVPAEGDREVVIRYAQRLRGCRYGYVTTTAAAWGEPLERAELSFRVPADLDVVAHSLDAPFERSRRGGDVLWTADVEGFVPRRDMELSWACAAGPDAGATSARPTAPERGDEAGGDQ